MIHLADIDKGSTCHTKRRKIKTVENNVDIPTVLTDRGGGWGCTTLQRQQKNLVFRISSCSVVKMTHNKYCTVYTLYCILMYFYWLPSFIWFGLVQSSITFSISGRRGTPRSKPDFFCFSYFPEVATHLVNYLHYIHFS